MVTIDRLQRSDRIERSGKSASPHCAAAGRGPQARFRVPVYACAFRLNNGSAACYLRAPLAVTSMPDLLLELFSEEIPARMQVRAAEDLRKLVTDRLVGAGLLYEGAKAFVTPRRLALAVKGVPVRQPDVKEEKKGPRV